MTRRIPKPIAYQFLQRTHCRSSTNKPRRIQPGSWGMDATPGKIQSPEVLSTLFHRYNNCGKDTQSGFLHPRSERKVLPDDAVTLITQGKSSLNSDFIAYICLFRFPYVNTHKTCFYLTFCMFLQFYVLT